jgi:alanine dehydrogenase
MRVVSADDIERVLSHSALIDALDAAFRGEIVVPVRHHHTLAQPGADATLLLMPAWTVRGERFLGCKVVTVFPGNAKVGRPSLYGSYLLLSGDTGEPLAVMDGRVLTAWRTGAASALAAKFLARADATNLVMLGAGALAPHLVRAHCTVRPIRKVSLWNRTRGHAASLASGLDLPGVAIELVDDLKGAVRSADIVSCATLSATPLIRGEWLKPGAHVDLVGAFTPAMREADDAAVTRARVFVDTRAGALKEGGDLVIPLAQGTITPKHVQGDLSDLCRGAVAGRTSDSEITLFKSVGTAIEDLAAAMLVWRALSAD